MLSPEDIDRLRVEFDTQLRDSGAAASEGHRCGTAAVSRAIEPYYSLTSASSVPLYAGPLLFPSGDGETGELHVNGTASLELMPQPQILLRATARRLLRLGELLDGQSGPQLPTMSSLPPAAQGPLDTGDSSWLGPPRGYVVGKASAAKTVTFHLVNFMQMPGAVITDGVNAWAGRVVATVGPWIVTIDARSDLPEVLRGLDGGVPEPV